VAKRAPCVDMRTDIHKDERFAALADVAGLPGGRYEAVGRMHALYSWCVDRKLKDAPEDSDGYVVSAGVVVRFLGQSGVMALLAEGCDELALGIEIGTGRYYLRGTSEYVSTMRALNRFASAGGKSRTEAGSRKEGRFVTDHTITPAVSQPQTSREPAADQPATSREPAATSALPLTSYLLPKEVDDVSGKPDAAALFASVAVAEINRLASTRYKPETAHKLCRALVKAKHTPEQAVLVVRSKREWLDDPKMRQYFRPATLLALSNFSTYLDDLESGSPAARTNGPIRIAAPDDDEPRLGHLLDLGASS